MNKNIAKKLCDINTAFYLTQAQSFSATRSRGWEGWDRCVQIFNNIPYTSILDLACGNMRFENYLIQTLTSSKQDSNSITFYAVDNCDALAAQNSLAYDTKKQVDYQSLNIIDTLLSQQDLSLAIKSDACDIAVCFGFMHHVPGQDTRDAVLEALICHTKAEGLIVLSFWQFMKNENLARKAEVLKDKAMQQLNITDNQLDPGDYFLGWKDTEGIYRYCHNFNEDEVGAMVKRFEDQVEVVDSFYADGKSHDLNLYLVLKKK